VNLNVWELDEPSRAVLRRAAFPWIERSSCLYSSSEAGLTPCPTRPEGSHQQLDAENIEHPRQIIG